MMSKGHSMQQNSNQKGALPYPSIA